MLKLIRKITGNKLDLFYKGIVFTALENGARRLTGENVAIGQTSAKQVFEDWMNSPGHRGNILSASYTSIGIGVAKCTASGYTGFCWAQMFAG